MLRYRHNNFNLVRPPTSQGRLDSKTEILEYCDKNSVIEKEQQSIDLFKPEHKILTKVGFSLGFKHFAQTLLKFKTPKLSYEALTNLKKAK